MLAFGESLVAGVQVMARRAAEAVKPGMAARGMIDWVLLMAARTRREGSECPCRSTNQARQPDVGKGGRTGEEVDGDEGNGRVAGPRVKGMRNEKLESLRSGVPKDVRGMVRRPIRRAVSKDVRGTVRKVSSERASGVAEEPVSRCVTTGMWEGERKAG